MKKQDTVFLVWNAAAPVLIGAVIYILLSPDVRFLKAAEQLLHFSMPETPSLLRLLKPTPLRGILPDALWGYALVFAMTLVTGSQPEERIRLWALALVFSASLELLQLFCDACGTFDIWDIAAEWGAETLALVRIQFYFEREKKNE